MAITIWNHTTWKRFYLWEIFLWKPRRSELNRHYFEHILDLLILDRFPNDFCKELMVGQKITFFKSKAQASVTLPNSFFNTTHDFVIKIIPQLHFQGCRDVFKKNRTAYWNESSNFTFLKYRLEGLHVDFSKEQIYSLAWNLGILGFLDIGTTNMVIKYLSGVHSLMDSTSTSGWGKLVIFRKIDIQAIKSTSYIFITIFVFSMSNTT